MSKSFFLLIPGMLLGLAFYAIGFTILYFVIKRAIVNAHKEINKIE